ncbi:hypothetical protein FQR65_LT20275 [Abscondita terminalis]|nr:hypothetical protein FQR65_LT20275 [Abscondita terminalis]
MKRELRNDITDLNSIYKSPVKSRAIYRYDQFTSATVSAAPAPGVSLAEGIEEIERIKTEVLGENFKTSLAGQSRDL